MKKQYSLFVLSLLLLFLFNLLVGSVKIPAGDVLAILAGRGVDNEAWRYIVLETRLPQALTAMLSGSALAVSGLLLQTAFRNPLAGPSIFGISSGAGLGVALVMLLLGGSLTTQLFSLTGFMAVLLAAFVGAAVVTAVILLFSTIVRNDVLLLIIGIMVGYLANSAITLLNFAATEEGVRSYMVWGLGHFGGVSMTHMPLFATVIVAGLTGAVLLVKPLNALLLGERYAENLGIDTRRMRHLLLLITGLLTSIVTAYCGPIAFIGLAVPHIARLLLSSENHRRLLPATICCGAAVALLCNLLCVLPAHSILPLNAVTPMIGAPVIIYVLVKRR